MNKIPKTTRMNASRILITVLFFYLLPGFGLQAQKSIPPVILDEEYGEWSNVTDIANVSETGNSTIKALNTSEYLFLYFEVQDIIELQSDNRMILYIDADNNSQTGAAFNGIGAELVYHFGNRSGTVYLNNNQYSVGPGDLFMVISPTVWSDRFEISLDRNVEFGGSKLFSSGEIKVLMKDNGTGNYSPASSGGASYTFGSYSFDPLPGYSISKQADSLVRVMSHNVHFDDLFQSTNQPGFKRMYQAIDPQIIGLQEIYDHSAEETAALIETFLPSEKGENWYYSQVADNIVVSRYLIKETYPANDDGNGAFLIDLRPDYNTDLLVINAHTPCCDNNSGRQYEIDAMMSFIRDAKNGSDELHIQENTPIMLIGDMNVVGDPQHIQTLLTGNIINESDWGSDFTPDWDGSHFEDAKPLASSLPMTFTHWSENGSGNYSNGRLDMIVYSGSALDLHNSYVMYTNALPQDSLSAYSLDFNDSKLASDHLPLVADFGILNEQPGHTILNLRANDADGLPAYSGKTVTVSGVVTVDEALGDNLAFIQDDDAGIALYGNEFCSAFTGGDSVTVTGNVTGYNGLTEIIWSSGSSQVTVHVSNKDVSPESVTIEEIKTQNWDDYELIEGKLVKISEITFVESGSFAGNTNYRITDGNDTLAFRINSNTNLVGEDIPTGKTNVTGIVSQFDTAEPYSAGYQLLPRGVTDLEIFEALPGILKIRQNDESGIPMLLDSIITVSGTVTASDELGTSGPAYMQDTSAGVALYGEDLVSQINTGDSITITSRVGFYNGLTELVYDQAVTQIEIHKSSALNNPEILTISEILNQSWNDLEQHEGKLIRLNQVEFVETGNFDAGNMTLTDGENELTLRVEYETDIVDSPVPSGKGAVIGVLGQWDNTSPYSQGYQLLPRSKQDLLFDADRELTLLKPDKNSSVVAGDSLLIQWTSASIEQVDLYRMLANESSWTLIAQNIEAASGSYNWITPESANDSCQIKIQVSDDNSFYAVSEKFFIDGSEQVVSTEQINPSSESKWKLFPNPFSDQLNIEFYYKGNQSVVLNILDLRGAIQYSEKFRHLMNGMNQRVIRTDCLLPGAYLIRLTSNGKVIASEMVVKF